MRDERDATPRPQREPLGEEPRLSEPTPFEREARAVLEASALRLSGRTQSRLTQARHRALEELERRAARPSWYRALFGAGGGEAARGRALAPVGALAVVALVAGLIWLASPGGLEGLRDGGMLAARPDAAASFEDIDMLVDAEALDLAAETDHDFVEWAALVAALDAGAQPDADADAGAGTGAESSEAGTEARAS